jgi:hypothetical protein
MTNTTNINDFFPEWYELPKWWWGNYTKFWQWETKIRILTSPLLGWVYFNEEKKPVRFPYKEIPKETPWIKKWDKLKEFWAVPVWNYNENCIQIMELTQIWIKWDINWLCRDNDWGDPREYDLKIIRKWEWKDNTKYTVIPSNKSKYSDEISEAWMNTDIDLKKLLTNEDPFLWKN